MDNNKETGSYYTPQVVIDFMIEYLKKNEQNFENVLEPSAGDGRFLSVLLPESKRVKAIELFENKVQGIKERYPNSKLSVQKINFLDYAIGSKEKFSLIIGNPPYINPKIMGAADITKAKKICELENIHASVMQNMWLAFVVGACRLLDKNGAIFYVLPMEFLQVQYAEKLRKHLEDKFNTIHIISFKSSIFPEIEQDVCLVYMTNKEDTEPHILYQIYESPFCCEPMFRNVITKNKPLRKWSNAVLSDENIKLLREKANKYNTINDIGISAPGIVTGGNKCFIITEKQVEEYECEELVIPILQKSSYISDNTIAINDQLIKGLKDKNKPVYLLNLSDVKSEDIPEKLSEYLEKAGEGEVGGIKLKERFKCANRKPWYGVPIVKKGEVIFFKRYHLLPRVYINQIGIHTTDAGYHIRLKPEWDKDSVVFCFYNSLTLAECEFQGRYYGGGVNELVPSEFKEVHIPYQKINTEDVEKLERLFHRNAEIDQIVAFVNEKTIAMDMEKQDVEELERIRKLLIQRRCGGK